MLVVKKTRAKNGYTWAKIGGFIFMLDLNNEAFNREYDEVRKDFEERLYNERLQEWLKWHDDSEGFPGVDMNKLPVDDLCRLLKELMYVASQYEVEENCIQDLNDWEEAKGIGSQK